MFCYMYLWIHVTVFAMMFDSIYSDGMIIKQSVASLVTLQPGNLNVVTRGQFLLDVGGLVGVSSVYILRARSLRGEYFTFTLPVDRSLNTQTHSTSNSCVSTT